MAEPQFLMCRGFEENVVLAVKTCFYEAEMRELVIERGSTNTSMMGVYHSRKCEGIVHDGVSARVSLSCRDWFNTLTSTDTFPQIDTNEGDFDMFHEEVEEFGGEQLEEVEFQIDGEHEDEGDVHNEVKCQTEETVRKSKQLECDICGQLFYNKKSLGIHKGRRHKVGRVKEKMYKCLVEDCKDSTGFETQQIYKKHLRLVHQLPKRGRRPKDENDIKEEDQEKEKETNKCTICGKVFDSKLNLSKHVRRCHETSHRPCHICGLMVKELAIHVKHQHTQKDLKNYFCEFCGRGFKGYSGYQFHVAGHTGEKKYTCGGCAKSFRTSSEAKKCERGHQGIYKWNCTHCTYRCHQKNKFVRHLRTHTKSEPYACPLCDHRAARKDYLQKHVIKAHSGYSLDQVETMHPTMYNIQEKAAWVEGRESRTTEEILECISQGRLKARESPQQDENIEEEKEDKTKVREVRELLVTNTPNQGILLRREEALFKLHV